MNCLCQSKNDFVDYWSPKTPNSINIYGTMLLYVCHYIQVCYNLGILLSKIKIFELLVTWLSYIKKLWNTV